MVFINEKKYSCEACIKGHRSSGCKHTDRPLFEIKKKGRPVTQCEHCRELRKTKQVHVKCICEGKSPVAEDQDDKGKKGQLKKALDNAAYPLGLLAASNAATKPPSEPSSDSDHHTRARSSDGCECKDGQECHCCTPKYQPRRRAAVEPNSTPASHVQPSATRRRGSTTLRPVLPKPVVHADAAALSEHSDTSGSAHRPHLHRSTHGSTFFSPYGRAYNEHFIHDDPAAGLSSQSDPLPSFDDLSAALSLPDVTPPSLNALPDFSQWDAPVDLSEMVAPTCACGNGCMCPGCVEHQGADAWFTQECANPGMCTTCFTSLTNPRVAPPLAPTPPTTPLGSRPTHEFELLERWLDSLPSSSSNVPEQGFPDMAGLIPNMDSQQVPMDLDIEHALNLPAYCAGFCMPGHCSCVTGSDTAAQSDAPAYSDDYEALDPGYNPSTFSLTSSLPDLDRDTVSSIYNGVDGIRRASSTSSLLPAVAIEAENPSLMARTLSPRSLVAPLIAATPVQQRPRGARSQRSSGVFFEAAMHRMR